MSKVITDVMLFADSELAKKKVSQHKPQPIYPSLINLFYQALYQLLPRSSRVDIFIVETRDERYVF